MADLLTAVKSVRTHQDVDDIDSWLSAVKTTKAKSREDEQPPSVLVLRCGSESSKHVTKASSPEEALQILRAKPSPAQLLTALHQLSPADGGFAEDGVSFDLRSTGPLQTQIISTLISTIIPDFWPVFDHRQRSVLVACLRNVTGINAVIVQLRLCTTPNTQNAASSSTNALDLLSVFDQVLGSTDTLALVHAGLQTAAMNDVKRQMAWKDFVNLIGSGKVTSVVAQAEDVSKSRINASWLSKGGAYATWLGQNISALLGEDDENANRIEGASLVLAKSVNLGYPNQLLQGLFGSLAHVKNQTEMIACLLTTLPAYTKRAFTEHLMRWLSTLDASDDHLDTESAKESVAALSGFLCITLDDAGLQAHICSTLTTPTLSTSISLSVRRASLAALSSSEDEDVQAVLDRTMITFSDPLFISHAPVLQQESLAQTLLIAAGYVHRASPAALKAVARSSSHMQGVSNRLDCSNTRARWLGMVVGTAISTLVDKEGSRMNFGTDELATSEALWYISLVNVHDSIGTVKDFAALLAHQAVAMMKRPARRHQIDVSKQMPVVNGKPVFGPVPPPAQTELIGERVTEVLTDDSEDDDDDLKPYAKPDSDPEDSDEDATLVNRNKVKPPVYIRDLMSMLRDDKSHDRFQLGIKYAAPLIRRKANFGKEVTDHAEELATILYNLQDPFETADFDELRLQALIAILLSDVKSLSPWLCRQVFSGDYSISQRCFILSAIGLGGRELAGLKNEDELNPPLEVTNFPTKRLPPHLHATYTTPSPSTKRLDAASKDMERALIQPLALQAADQSTAHLNAVKVRTFSSRMAVERTKRKPAANQLAKIFASAFFYPLANRYQQEIASYGSASVFASAPFVLVTYLRTLALLLHAAGPATAGLSEICGEFWELLLSLRVQAIADISILQAVLFGLLTLLEVFYDKQKIAQEFPKQLMQTQQWTDLIFEKTGGGNLVTGNGDDDEAKVRTLAASVLVKTQEIVNAYQKQLVGYAYDGLT